MSGEGLIKFAKELKEFREARNISLDQIFSRTRIDKKFLEAIEDGNYSIMPELYMKAFLKEYSQAVGLEPKEVLKRFESAKGGHQPQEEKPSPKSETAPETPKKQVKTEFIYEPEETGELDENEVKKEGFHWAYLFGALGVLAVVLVYFFFIREPDNMVKEPSYHPEAQRYDIGDKSKQQPAQQPIGDSLSLKISSTEHAYIRVTIDGRPATEFYVDSFQDKYIKAKSKFALTIGNATKVKMFLNNNPLDLSSKKANVIRALVDSAGVHFPVPKKFTPRHQQKSQQESPKTSTDVSPQPGPEGND